MFNDSVLYIFGQLFSGWFAIVFTIYLFFGYAWVIKWIRFATENNHDTDHMA